MRTLDFFVVDIPKRLNDTIRTQGGLELFVDTKFDEFSHRITEGEVVASPERYDIEVSSGDTLYFHHLVVVNDGQPLTGVENHYIVKSVISSLRSTTKRLLTSVKRLGRSILSLVGHYWKQLIKKMSQFLKSLRS
jgi:hypothetical protein